MWIYDTALSTPPFNLSIILLKFILFHHVFKSGQQLATTWIFTKKENRRRMPGTVKKKTARESCGAHNGDRSSPSMNRRCLCWINLQHSEWSYERESLGLISTILLYYSATSLSCRSRGIRPRPCRRAIVPCLTLHLWPVLSQCQPHRHCIRTQTPPPVTMTGAWAFTNCKRN